jgi:hypothetical protein
MIVRTPIEGASASEVAECHGLSTRQVDRNKIKNRVAAAWCSSRSAPMHQSRVPFGQASQGMCVTSNCLFPWWLSLPSSLSLSVSSSSTFFLSWLMIVLEVGNLASHPTLSISVVVMLSFPFPSWRTSQANRIYLPWTVDSVNPWYGTSAHSIYNNHRRVEHGPRTSPVQQTESVAAQSFGARPSAGCFLKHLAGFHP